MKLSRVSNPSKYPVSIGHRLKSWNIEYNFNSLNSASVSVEYRNPLLRYLCLRNLMCSGLMSSWFLPKWRAWDDVRGYMGVEVLIFYIIKLFAHLYVRCSLPNSLNNIDEIFWGNPLVLWGWQNRLKLNFFMRWQRWALYLETKNILELKIWLK